MTVRATIRVDWYVSVAHRDEAETALPTYGFRLFSTELRKGRGRKVVEVQDCGGSHYLTVAQQTLEEMKDRTFVGMPSPTREQDNDDVAEVPDEDGDVPEFVGKQAFRVDSVEVVDQMLKLEVWAGTYGDHERAIGSPGQGDLDITDRAPSRRYRAILNLPEEGTRGLLAVEDISRSCPVSLILRWMARVGQESAKDQKHEDGTAKDWWRLVVQQVSDPGQLDRLLDQGRLGALELVKHEIGGDRNRRNAKFILTAPRISEGKIDDVRQLVKSWVGRQRPADAPPMAAADADKQGAAALAAITSPELVDLDFDDGYVVVTEGGKQKKLSPSRVSELFIYPVDEKSRPSRLAFESAVQATALRIQPAERLDLDWPVE